MSKPSQAAAARPHEAGFTLVEVVVAMGVAMVVLAALLSTSISAVKASMSARIDQQAGDLLTKTIEDARSLDYGSVAMATADLSSDASITGNPPMWTVPNGVGPEPVIAAATGSISPHIATVTANSNNVQFTLKQYVTQPDGETARRVTAVVSWDTGLGERTRIASTMVVNSRTGLPLPSYTLSTTGGAITSVNPGSTLQIPFILKNLGARDSFELRALIGGIPQIGWTFYPDNSCSGGLDPSNLPTALSLSGGVPVTGELYPDSTTCFVATFTPSTVGTFQVVIQATSTKQSTADSAVMETTAIPVTVSSGAASPTPTPTSSTASPSPTTSPTSSPSPTPTPTITSMCEQPSPLIAAPSGYTLRRFILQNVPTGDTATIPTNPMQKDDCNVQIGSHAYSTNLSEQPGRTVLTGGSTANAGSSSVAEWRWLAPTITQVQGPAAVRIVYKCEDGSRTLTTAIGDWNQTANNNQWTSRGTASTILTCNDNWNTAQIPITANSFYLRSKTNANAVPTYLTLRMAVSGGSVRLNYDSSNAPSALFIGTNP